MFSLLKSYATHRSAGTWTANLLYIICLIFVLPAQGIMFFVNIMTFNFGQAFINLMICLAILFGWDFMQYIDKAEAKKKGTVTKMAEKGVEPVMTAAQKLDEALANAKNK